MSLYENQFNLNCFAVMMNLLLHVIICATQTQRKNDSRYTVQFNIWYSEKCLSMLNFVTFENTYKIIRYDQ